MKEAPMREERFYAFIIAHTFRSRARIRRFSVRNLWPQKSRLFARRASEEGPVTMSHLVGIVISCLSPHQIVENILGDLHEEYTVTLKASGRLKAKIWLYKQLLKSTIPLVHSRIKTMIFSGSKTQQD